MNAKSTIKVLSGLPIDKPMLLRAKHGVGKSSVVRLVATDFMKSLDGTPGTYHDVRLSQCEVGDIKGMPLVTVSANGRKAVEFVKPKWWPTDPDSVGILFFDEMNRATKDVLQAIFEICLDRRLDGEFLPKGWRVVAAINADDNYDVIELDPALLDRWFVIDFDPTLQEWVTWGREENSSTGKPWVREEVIQFIQQNPTLLDPSMTERSGEVGPSRRSWCSLSESLTAMDLWDGKDPGMFVQITKGWVGASIANLFQKFVDSEFSQIKPVDILNRWDQVKDKVVASLSDIEVITALANAVTQFVKVKVTKEKKKLTDKQSLALKEFLSLLPADVFSHNWTEIVSFLRMVAIGWRDNDPAFAAIVQSRYIAPNSSST